jgi:hypothetical protein
LAADGMNTIIEWSNPHAPVKKGSQRALTTLTKIPAYLNSKINDLTGNKILIGWVLGKDVMKAAGTIEFAIRFFKRDADGEIEFSWSTVPESLVINKTLQYDLDGEIDDTINSVVHKRITNMKSSGVGGLVNPPVFWLNLSSITGSAEDNSLVTDYTPGNGINYIDIPTGSTEYVAYVAAKTGTYNCTYSWQYHDIGVTGYSDYNDYEDAYLVVPEDMDYDSLGLVLYKKEGDKYIEAKSVTAADVKEGAIYYRVSKCTIKKPGYYKASANVITSSANVGSSSTVLVVPGPAKPQIVNESQENQKINNAGYISATFTENDNATIKVNIKDNS